MCDGREVKKDEMRASKEGRDSFGDDAVTADAVFNAVVVNAPLVASVVAFASVVVITAETLKE